jgi:hypothetical protein
LLKLERSAINPSRARSKPVIRLLFFMQPPRARILSRALFDTSSHCDRNSVFVSPQPETQS